MMTLVHYSITPGTDPEAFQKLRILVQRLLKKYPLRCIANGYDAGYAIDLHSSKEIGLTLETPGLSSRYVSNGKSGGRAERREEYNAFCRGDGAYPPNAAVVCAVLLGAQGDDQGYLFSLSSKTKLMDADGKLCVTTSLTRSEAGRLAELLRTVHTEQEEICGEY